MPVATLLLSVVGFFLALHALSRRHSPQGALAWIVTLLLAPPIGIPAYLLLGLSRMRPRWHILLSKTAIAKILQGVAPFNKVEAGSVGRTLERLTKLKACGGNRLNLLRDGNETYRALEQAMRNAKRSIMVEFFIIRHDRVGKILRNILIERVQAGVDVYVIYDELGSRKLPPGYLRSMRRAGVKVASFNGRRYWWSSFMRLNYRNHRKLVIIDGRLAYIGSANVGLEYLHSSCRTYWRDTFASLKGPVVNQAMLCFAEDWRRSAGEDISRLAVPAQAEGDVCCQLIPSGPDDAPTNAWETTLIEMAAQAKARLWIATPYFVPTPAVLGVLQNAAIRGADVRLLVPRRGDNILTNLALLTYLPSLIAAGAHVLAYTPGILHEKIALADDNTCTIGTANLDERSLRLNFELTLLASDIGICSQVETLLLRDMEHARELTPADWYRLSVFKKLSANVCRLLSPIL